VDLGKILRKTTGLERRRHRRYKNVDGVRVEFQNENIKTVSNKTCRDLSISGIRFLPGVELIKKEVLDMVLTLPDSYPGPKKVVLQAQVVEMCRPSRMGDARARCKFVNMKPEVTEHIHNFLEWIGSLET